MCFFPLRVLNLFSHEQTILLKSVINSLIPPLNQFFMLVLHISYYCVSLNISASVLHLSHLHDDIPCYQRV